MSVTTTGHAGGWEFKPFHDIISADDCSAYFNVIMEAWEIHLEKEKVRHALWKKYPARDQLNMIKVKTERCLHTLDVDPEAGANVVVAEVPDIINYAVFAQRLVTETI